MGGRQRKIGKCIYLILVLVTILVSLIYITQSNYLPPEII